MTLACCFPFSRRSPSRSSAALGKPSLENDIRQVLGGLTSVVKGIGALRTHAGDAHGREKGYRRIDTRIARFAINAASSIALFLIDTWERQQGRALPLRREAAGTSSSFLPLRCAGPISNGGSRQFIRHSSF
jgi:hypothetical protein